MEIVAMNGRRVIVDSRVDVDVLVRIMRGLETLR
jgi:transposase